MLSMRSTCLAILGIIVYDRYRFTLFQDSSNDCNLLSRCSGCARRFFHILNKELNSLLITALLDYNGYSLSDTVVVFDRIRENMGGMKSRDDLAKVMNRSINEVLCSRTIITGISTILALGALMLLGGEVLFDFSFALLIGLIVGTYSSIFVASPASVLFMEKSCKVDKKLPII